MNPGIKRFFTACASAVAAVSCSYFPEVIPQGTYIDIQVDMESLKGTQALVSYTPHDDRVYYLADVISVKEYNIIADAYDGKVDIFINEILKAMYDDYAKAWEIMYSNHAYRAPFKNAELIYGKYSRMIVGLTPKTDYYALAYCVDCVNDSTFRIKGDLFKEKFTTTDVQADLSKMKLEYMVHDHDGKMHLYTRPTYKNYDIQHDGKICRDQYFVDMISKKDMDEQYGGNPFAFALNYYSKALELGILNDILYYDISRREYDMTDVEEGEQFYIVGAPYNITNLNKLYVLEFTYTKNMNTDYESEFIENDLSE